MFEDAIEKVAGFTRSVHSIIRYYGSNYVTPATASLFFVNELGCAITCNHVLHTLINEKTINEKWDNFKLARQKLSGKAEFEQNNKKLESEYQYKSGTIVQIKSVVFDCVDPVGNVGWHRHPNYDLAIIIFEGFKNILYKSHAVFVKDSIKIKQGRSLCRLGYPFPEFTDFAYNKSTDDIEWTTTGRPATPRFPIDGIITRFLTHNNAKHGIEMSTPGLVGQSGGPLFDTNGIVHGMQYATDHLYLGFDINKEILAKGKKTRVNNQPFLHVGRCLHVDIIKEFLKAKNIKFYEE